MTTLKPQYLSTTTDIAIDCSNATAILGGAFDPVHFGHLNPAINIAKWLGFATIKLLPTHIPVHKQPTSASAEHRLAMLQRVCEQYPLFQCDPRELLRHGPSYTVDSLQEIKQEQPNTPLFFLIGADSLLSFTTWHQWQRILTLCHLIISTRPHHELAEFNPQTQQLIEQHKVDNLSELLTMRAGGILFAPPSYIDISSTDLRQQYQTTLTTQNLIPPVVQDYINQWQLYR